MKARFQRLVFDRSGRLSRTVFRFPRNPSSGHADSVRLDAEPCPSPNLLCKLSKAG